MGHAKSTIAHRELFASLLVTIVICCLTSAKAQIIYVDSAPPEPYCVNITCGTSVCPCWSIQNAIDQVPYNSTTYEVLVMPGTYRGEKNTNITFAGKQLTLRSTNGSESTFIECNPLFTVGFMFYSGEQRTSQVKGFTLNYCFLVITNGLPFSQRKQIIILEKLTNDFL
jgi:pectin methylesterase-like acyl-CoA thioesterase